MHACELKMIMKHCQGEDYNNPKNAICAQALDRFNKVSRQAFEFRPSLGDEFFENSKGTTLFSTKFIYSKHAIFLYFSSIFNCLDDSGSHRN